MQVNVSVSFEADSADEAKKVIEKWKLPEGAAVFASGTEPIAGGQTTVVKGKLKAPENPEPPDPAV